MRTRGGVFTVSLDFELHYGVSDSRTVADYRQNLRATPAAVDGMLRLFERYGVHATWATVGMLFCQDKQELLRTLPPERPTYAHPTLSNYRLLPELGTDADDDPYHFAWPLIQRIVAVAGQEIGTHTFSHFYCLERGPSLTAFEADLRAAIAIAAQRSIPIRSIVFPRNQYSDAHLEVCARLGLIAYRGTESHWFYATRSREEETRLRRAGRLVDAYLPITRNHNTCVPAQNNRLLNVPASRFLRPVPSYGAVLEPLRLRRICTELRTAARSGQLYHLWWHPHNFGGAPEKNLALLERILSVYAELRTTYGMQSLNMAELAQSILHEH